MRKIYVILLLILSIFACREQKDDKDLLISNNQNNGNEMNYELTPGITITPEEAEKIIKNRLFEILEIIRKKEIKKLIPYIHPIKGIRFSLSYLVTPNDRVLYRKDFENYEDDTQEYIWGYNEQTKEAIKYTKSEYLKREFNYDYTKADSITYNNMVSQVHSRENQWVNYENSIIVEVFYEGKKTGLEWIGQRLAFQEYKGEWYLVGTLYSTWSP